MRDMVLLNTVLKHCFKYCFKYFFRNLLACRFLSIFCHYIDFFTL